MSDRAKDTFGLILVGFGIVAVILFLLLSLPLILGIVLVILAAILFIVAALVIVGVLAAVPYYFIKHGAESEPSNSYRLEDVKPIKEDEKK